MSPPAAGQPIHLEHRYCVDRVQDSRQIAWLQSDPAVDEDEISTAEAEIYARVIQRYPRPLTESVTREPALDFLFPRVYRAADASSSFHDSPWRRAYESRCKIFTPRPA